jgi:hypothetical protein
LGLRYERSRFPWSVPVRRAERPVLVDHVEGADREDKIALVAGLGLLIMALLAPFAVVGVLDTLVGSGDPTALEVKNPPRPRRP